MKQTLQLTAKTRTVFWLIMVTGLILSGSFHANALLTQNQLDEIKKEYAFFQNRYYKNNVWDCSRSPANATAGAEWELSGFQPPYDSSQSYTNIDFGTNSDRYLQFDIEEQGSNTDYSYISDENGNKLVISLKLYEADGRFVSTVSTYGTIQGLGEEAKGLFYEQKGHYGTFFTFEEFKVGDEVTYTPETGVIQSLSELSLTKLNLVWAFDSDASTMTHKDGTPTINNVTADNDKLSIGNNTSFSGNLDLTGAPIADKNNKVYILDAIGANAFKEVTLQSLRLPGSISSIGQEAFKGASIDSLHIPHTTPLADAVIGTDAFTLANKAEAIVYVPKGALEAYHTESITDITVTNWQGFTYILEEDGTTYDIEYVCDKEEYKDAISKLPTKAPVGQLFTFQISIPNSKFNITTTNTITGSDLFSYDSTSEKFAVKLTDSPTNNKLTIKINSSINTDSNKGLIIEANDQYKEGGNGTIQKFDGTINAGQIESLEIGKDNESSTINIIVKETTVTNPDPDEPATTITASTTATLNLSGTNDLGRVENNGSLTLKKEKDSSPELGENTRIMNNGVFTDYTGLITEVEGDADMTIEPINNQNIPEGSSATLKAIASTKDDKTLTYAWEKQNQDGTWPSEAGLPQLRSVATNEYQVSEAGLYRCLISAEAGPVKTTLSAIATVTTYPNNPIEYYDVLLPTVEGATTNPAPGTYAVQEYDSFWFTLTLDEDYNQSKPVVMIGDKEIKADIFGRYIVDYIQGYTEIKISGVILNPAPVGTDEADQAKATVWEADGILYIHTPTIQSVNVYLIAGGLYKELGSLTGDTRITLPKGTYIVTIGREAFKVVL